MRSILPQSMTMVIRFLEAKIVLFRPMLTFEISALARQQTCLKPVAFFRTEDQLSIAVGHINLIVPPNVAATKNGNPSFSITCENPLFAVLVLKIADVFIVGVSINNWRISTGGRVTVSNLKKRC